MQRLDPWEKPVAGRCSPFAPRVNAVCQVALVPAIWPWTGLPRDFEGTVNYLQEVGQPRDTQGGGQAVAGVTALVTTAILRQRPKHGDPVVAEEPEMSGIVRPAGRRHLFRRERAAGEL